MPPRVSVIVTAFNEGDTMEQVAREVAAEAKGQTLAVWGDVTDEGQVKEVADKIRMHNEALGISHYMGAFSRGGLAHDKVTRSMRLFAEKVMPRFA